MSLLASIQAKKNNLIKSTTIVTKISGEKFEEIFDSGEFKELKLSERHAGYVVDLKPDFQVAQVLPYLVVGSQDIASNLQLLQHNGITHILSVGVKPSDSFSEITYMSIDLLDTPEESLLNILPKAISMIKSVKKISGAKVLVHCNAGCSRSPAVVIGYLMYSFGYTYQEAFKIVANERQIRPNDGFIKQLQLYELQLSLNGNSLP